MKISFIGTGSAFHTTLGNNNALVETDNESIFIDCGSTNFHRMLECGVLQNKKHITLFITHTHPDHIGSLGDLIFYTYYAMEPMFVSKFTLLVPSAIVSDVKQLLRIYGCESNQYELISIHGKYETEEFYINAFTNSHVVPILSFSMLITDKKAGETIYYSGDANTIPPNILEKFEKGIVSRIYQDTCMLDYQNNPHLSLSKLEHLIPIEQRQRVTCMHLDGTFDRNKAEELGFQVAEPIKKA